MKKSMFDYNEKINLVKENGEFMDITGYEKSDARDAFLKNLKLEIGLYMLTQNNIGMKIKVEEGNKIWYDPTEITLK